MTSDSLISKRLVGLFLLGYVLLNFPLVSLFNRVLFIAGIPLLYGYIYLVWALLIIMVMLIVNTSDRGQ